MTLAVTIWCLALIIALGLLRYFLRHGRIAAVAVLLILLPQVYARPILFFLGLDQPFPYEYFDGPDWDLIATALSVSVVWVTLFTIAYLTFARPVQPLGRLLPQAPPNVDPRVLLLITLFTTTLGVALTGQLILAAGSLELFMYQVKIGKEMTGAYVIRQVSVVGAMFSVLIILYYARRSRSPERRRGDRGWMWLGVGLLAVNFAFNYFWGNRYNIAMLGFALGLAWHYHIQPLRLRRIIFLVLIAAVTLQGLKLFRNTAVEEALGREIVRDQTFWTDVSTSLHLNQFDAFMLALRDAGERFRFREGKDFVNGLLAWVPRQLYPEKETFHVGQWFRQVYEPNTVNGWPITTMGSWYVNFAGLGLIFGAIVSGLMAAWFDAGYRNIRGSFWQAAVAPAMALLMFDGGVGTGFVQDIFLVMVPIYLLSLVLSLVGRRQTARHTRALELRAAHRAPFTSSTMATSASVSKLRQ